MNVIIAGSRYINDPQVLEDALRLINHALITRVISGHASGVDALGERWAKSKGLYVSIYPASAGPKRNQEMIERADMLLAVWDGESRGTKDIIRKAKRAKIPTFVYYYGSDNE